MEIDIKVSEDPETHTRFLEVILYPGLPDNPDVEDHMRYKIILRDRNEQIVDLRGFSIHLEQE